MTQIISSLWVVLSAVSMWIIFEKAGLEGWKGIIPVYNLYCLCKITWGSGWMFLTFIIPALNIITAIITMYKLAKVFGKSGAFCLGLILVNTIFLAILAFSDAQYNGPYIA